MKKSKLFVSILILILALLIIFDPARFISASLNGISAWALNVLPSILPFMILTKLLLSFGSMATLTKPFARPFARVYGTSQHSFYIFVMSILAGYPVGSKMTADLYESGQINKTTAYRMSSFCSNSGPMFIIGTVGSLLLKNAAVGGILFASHALSALINGLFYRKITAREDQKREPISPLQNNVTFGDIILSSVQGVLTVGAIICLFFIIIEALMPVVSLFPPSLRPLVEGSIELTRGCIDAASLPLFPAAVICSFVISFGGISTILQSAAMLKKLKMPIWLFTVQKLSQGLLSAAITALLMLLL